MAWKKSFFFILTIALCGVIGSGLFADAAAVMHPESMGHGSDMEKRNIKPADLIDGSFGSVDPDAGTNVPGVNLDSKGTETTPTPDVDKHDTDTTDTDNEPLDLDPPPPDTVNPPRKITFDYRTEFDFDLIYPDTLDGGVDIEVGSKEDEEASRWLVVTPSGFEYDGSPEVLREIFIDANLSLSFSLHDLIPQYGAPTSLDSSAVSPGFNLHSKRSVIGFDTRQRVFFLPYVAMGQVGEHCTGTFIGPRHILTAGHCVFSRDTLQWINNLNFRRGKDCDPDGGDLYIWRRALASQGWTESGLDAYDYGMIVVDRVSPYYMNFGWNDHLYRYIVNIAGYPADKTGNCMWHTSCTTLYHFTDQLGYECDTYNGMSGSAVYAYFTTNNRMIIYCIHAKRVTTSRNYNKCTRITSTKYDIFTRWITDY